MQRNATIMFFACLLLTLGSLQAQTRYLDPMFEVGEPSTEVYGQNIDVFLQGINQLEVDIYQPADENSSELRPVVVMFPTGNFLLQYLNQGPYGSRKDSAIVEIIDEVVSRGYVGMSAEYRTGWLPSSTIQDVRTSTLLQAAYRGAQDAHTLSRWLRKTVIEDGNPHQIDTSRIVFWGVGTGGYITMAHAFLDNIDEVLADARFYDEMGAPYVSLATNSNPQGTLPAALPDGTPTNIPNWLGYNSDVAMAVNTGGALGDMDWMEEDNDFQPIVLGYHSLSDPFAPFSFGNVIVPTTGDLVIGGVGGTEQIVETANAFGLNDAIASANDLALPAIYSDLSRTVNAINAQFKAVVIDPDPMDITGLPEFELSQDNMWPFFYQGDTVGAPYNWIDPTLVTAEIEAFNMATGQMINPLLVIGGESITNPNYIDPANARLVIDTMMAHFLPRAYIGMELGLIVGTEELVQSADIGLEVFPNPATAFIMVNTNAEDPMRDVTLFDLTGRQIANYAGIDTNQLRIDRGAIPAGQYFVRIRVDEGIVTQKIVLE